MRKLLIIFGAILCVNSHAQTRFEKGYFINNDGDKITCVIKNYDWKNNPKTFEYRLSETSEVVKSSTQEVQEFGISDIVIYKRFAVKIDRSRTQTEKLSNKRAPEFAEETLFLKVLVEGKASLYQFSDDGLLRFFFSNDGGSPTQLVYKEYRINDNRAVNDSYKQQLLNDLRCAELTETDVRNTAYSTSSLVRFFKRYNDCVQSPVKVYDGNDKVIFNLTLRPGVFFSSLALSDEFSGVSYADYGNNTSFRVGIEMELVLPFKKNQWSIVIEPTYQQFKANAYSGPTTTRSIEYNSIELPFGARRYFFISDKTKMFLNAQFLFDIPISSTVSLDVEDLKVKNNGSFTAGMGFNFKSKFSIESRYQFNRQLFNGYTFLDTKFHGIVLMVGYRF